MTDRQFEYITDCLYELNNITKDRGLQSDFGAWLSDLPDEILDSLVSEQTPVRQLYDEFLQLQLELA